MADRSVELNVSHAPRAAPRPATGPAGGAAAPDGGRDFKTHLLESLQRVNQLQQEADLGVQRLLTGETDNVSEVLVAVRKADVAFSLLMEIRNKLMDAYAEIRQMRV